VTLARVYINSVVIIVIKHTDDDTPLIAYHVDIQSQSHILWEYGVIIIIKAVRSWVTGKITEGHVNCIPGSQLVVRSLDDLYCTYYHVPPLLH